MSQTPTEPPSPRTLARASARGDLPYASELPLALTLIVLAGVGVQPIAAGLRGLAVGAWSGQVTPMRVWSSLLQPLLWLLSALAVAALASMLAQRAPTLRSAVGRGVGDPPRGRPGNGRALQALMSAVKVLVLSASLVALLFDSFAGWLDTHTRSATELLEISEHMLPAVLLRAAWVCVLLGGLELLVQQVARVRRLRMTRHDLRAEQRELAGDPRMLSEQRGRAHLSPQLAASDLMQLSAAAVVITGTACVVALEYSPELGVPRVWLSAEGPQALELLSRAYSLQLPIVSDALLAIALLRTPLRAAVPAEWHTRVAQLLVASAAPAAREAS